MINIRDHIQQHANRYIPMLIGVLLLTALLHTIHDWQHDWQLGHQAPTNSTSVTDETSDLIAALPDLHLFGQSVTMAGIIPITNLPLRVTSIVKIEGNNKTSSATILADGEPAKILHIGDTLPYGAKVYDIAIDSVILDNSGHLEKLPLARERLVFRSSNDEVTG